MMSCEVGSVYVLKTMEVLDFGEIFRGAERAINCHYFIIHGYDYSTYNCINVTSNIILYNIHWKTNILD